ncbi:MAG: hypothetical protein V1740_02840 [Candidatus Woesearchaeota archaeon]
MKKCHNCSLDIEDDAIYCRHCGRTQINDIQEGKTLESNVKDEKARGFDRIKEKTKLSGSRFLRIIKDYKSIWIILILIIGLLALFYYTNKPKPAEEIDIQFGDVPGHYKRSIIFTLFYDQPLSENETAKLKEFLEEMDKEGLPITLFLTAQLVNNTSTINDFFTNNPRLDFDANFLKNFNNTEVGTGGYINSAYDVLSYDDQEELIRQSKKAFRNQSIDVKGIILPGNRYNLDTFLAIENNKIEYLILQTPDIEPYHPPSLLGGKMYMLIFPISQAGLNDITMDSIGVFVFLLNKDKIGEIAEMLRNNQTILNPEIMQETWFPLLNEQNNFIREKEKMSARLTTDSKRMRSSLSINNIKNGTKVLIDTKLAPINMTSGNKTINFNYLGESLYFILDKNQTLVNIEWEKIN